MKGYPLKHETEIAVLVERIRARKAEIDTLDAQINVDRELVKTLLIDRGESWKDEHGYAMITSEGERVSYDTKALDELVLTDPVKYGWLHDYRRKSVVAASLKIK